jgi:hypothetical protein
LHRLEQHPTSSPDQFAPLIVLPSAEPHLYRWCRRLKVIVLLLSLPPAIAAEPIVPVTV